VGGAEATDQGEGVHKTEPNALRQVGCLLLQPKGRGGPCVSGEGRGSEGNEREGKRERGEGAQGKEG